MAFLSSITGPAVKQIPATRNIPQSMIVGAGAYRAARFLDGLIGNRVQSVGIPLPFIGSLSLLDLFMVATFKAAMKRNSNVAAAFAGDRILNLGQSLAQIAGLGGVAGSASNKNSPTSTSGPSGGGF